MPTPAASCGWRNLRQRGRKIARFLAAQANCLCGISTMVCNLQRVLNLLLQHGCLPATGARTTATPPAVWSIVHILELLRRSAQSLRAARAAVRAHAVTQLLSLPRHLLLQRLAVMGNGAHPPSRTGASAARQWPDGQHRDQGCNKSAGRHLAQGPSTFQWSINPSASIDTAAASRVS